MDEIIRGLCLIVTWYNSRSHLGAPAFETDDFTVVEYNKGDDGSWWMKAIHNDIADHFFVALYDGMAKQTLLTQYREVARDTVTDDYLNSEDEEVDVVSS